MPEFQAPCVELGCAPETPSLVASPSPSEVSSASSPEPPHLRATPLFRALAMRPPEPLQPQGQEELERRLPGYRRIVIPRELTLIELLKQCSSVTTDEEVLRIREAKLRVVADRVGLRRLHVLAPRLRCLTLDGSAISSLRDLGIGLVHLKILSVNRCSLSSLDGVWGLAALRELYAAGNRIRDLQPLAGIQKLHTLNLADNPISESSRIWTLGVCGSLRKLTLSGTEASEAPDYRSRIASALPMLVYLDDRPLHTDIEYDSEINFSASLSSDSEVEEEQSLATATSMSLPLDDEPVPSTSKQEDFVQSISVDEHSSPDDWKSVTRLRRRPATTENAGCRPTRPNVPQRPRTAHDRPSANTPTRLQVLSTLMDDEWLSSGSKLTSVNAVCGNLARALRRTASVYHRSAAEAESELIEDTIQDAARALAAEIPRAPCLEDWAKFKQDTGIDINIDFEARPEPQDPSKALERLEQIERETMERFQQETSARPAENNLLPNSAFSEETTSRHYDLWKTEEDLTNTFNLEYGAVTSVHEFDDMRSVSRETLGYLDDNESQTE